MSVLTRASLPLTRMGRTMDELPALSLDRDTLVVCTIDNGAGHGHLPDAGYTPLGGSNGSVRDGVKRPEKAR